MKNLLQFDVSNLHDFSSNKFCFVAHLTAGFALLIIKIHPKSKK